MAGLRKIARLYGAIVIQGKRYVWDYVREEPVLEKEMPEGSERWKASEKAKWSKLKTNSTD